MASPSPFATAPMEPLDPFLASALSVSSFGAGPSEEPCARGEDDPQEPRHLDGILSGTSVRHVTVVESFADLGQRAVELEFEASPPLSLPSSMGSLHESEVVFNMTDSPSDSTRGVRLVRSSFKSLVIRDLHLEHRPRRDIYQFVDNPDSIFLMDVDPTSMREVLQAILDAMVCAQHSYTEVDDLCRQEALETMLMENTAQITQAIHGFDCDLASQSSFSVLYFESPRLAHRHAAFVRLSRPANLGFLEARVQFLVFVCGPIREKGTKTVEETARGFGSFLAHPALRFKLHSARTASEARTVIKEFLSKLESRSLESVAAESPVVVSAIKAREAIGLRFSGKFAGGLRADVRRCIPRYMSDFRDGLFGRFTLRKTIAASFFVYFLCALSAIAFGVLLDSNTKGFFSSVAATVVSHPLCPTTN